MFGSPLILNIDLTLSSFSNNCSGKTVPISSVLFWLLSCLKCFEFIISFFIEYIVSLNRFLQMLHSFLFDLIIFTYVFYLIIFFFTILKFLSKQYLHINKLY